MDYGQPRLPNFSQLQSLCTRALSDAVFNMLALKYSKTISFLNT